MFQNDIILHRTNEPECKIVAVPCIYSGHVTRILSVPAIDVCLQQIIWMDPIMYCDKGIYIRDEYHALPTREAQVFYFKFKTVKWNIKRRFEGNIAFSVGISCDKY